MNVFIIATEDCNHRPIVEEQLKNMNIPYEVQYVDEHPDLIKKFEAHSSPNIIVNDEVVFRANQERSLPTEEELKKIVDMLR